MRWCDALAAIFRKRAVEEPARPADSDRTSEEVQDPTQRGAVPESIDALRGAYETHQKQQNADSDRNRAIAKVAVVVAALAFAISAGQAWFAHQALNETIRSNEMTQRAYVIVPRIDFTREKTPTDNPNVSVDALGVRVSYENGGLTPATITDSWIFTTNFSPADKAEHCPNVQNPQNVGLLVPPKVPREQRVYHASLEKALVASLADRSKSTVTLYGGLTYTDTFNKVRRTKYCFTLSPYFNSSTVADHTYDPERAKRSAFDACNFCNSWD